MRVLHIGKYYYPEPGGMESFLFDLINALRASGLFCDVLCFGRHGCAVEEAEGGTVTRIPPLCEPASTPIAVRMLTELIRNRKNYDVIHVHHPNPTANLALLAARPRAKVIVHWHSDILRQEILMRLYSPLLEWMMRRADAVVATSEPYLQGSEWLTRHRDKVAVIPLGIDPDRIGMARPRPTSSAPRAGESTLIVFSLGRLVGYKGFEYLIRSALELPERYRVVIGGDGPLRGSLEKLVRDLGLTAKVTLAGEIPPERLSEYYQECRAFALPSTAKTEAFGIVQLEAFSMAKPVIATDIPGSGTAWVNQHGLTGLVVPPRDPHALAAAIRTLCESPNYEDYAARAKDRFETLFHIKRVAERVECLYRGLI